MPDGRPKGLFQSILQTLDLGRSQADLVLDSTLMLAWADGTFSLAEQDALERALADGELGDVTWAEVLERADEISQRAPFFADIRKRLIRARWPREDKRMALGIAARVATAGSPLEDEQRALLYSLAEGLGISEGDVQDLLPPWGFDAAPKGAVRWTRSSFSDPEQLTPTTLFDALLAADDDELRALVFKLEGPRDVASLRFESAQITQVGRLVELGGVHLRIDGVIEGDDQEWLVRCVAVGEALFPKERILWPAFVAGLASHQRLVIARQGVLSPGDREVVGALPADRLVEIELPPPRTAAS